MLSALRHAPDRLLHAPRHRQALEDVRALTPGGRVLVVCYGNICRSPYAAALLRRALEHSGIAVESAGFVGPNRGVPAFAAATAGRRGTDLSAHRSQLLSAGLVQAAQLILVMDSAQRARLQRDWPAASPVVLLGDLDPLPIAKRAIRDPYDQTREVFEEVFTRIERCTDVLVQRLAVGATVRPVSAPSTPPGDAAGTVAPAP
jgi:protein-tyrosine phosphatase